MTRLIMVSIIFVGLLQVTMSVAASTSDLGRCVGSLHAFENSIKGGQSSVGADWVRGQRGALLMDFTLGKISSPTDKLKDLENYVGSRLDISSCSRIGVAPGEIKLFLLAFHGYLSSDPFEDLSRCYAAMLQAAPELDKRFGAQVANALSFPIGERFGAAVVEVNYLNKSKKATLQDVQARGMKISSSLSAMPPEKRIDAVKSHVSRCEWYGVPLMSLIDGAGRLKN